MASGLNCAILEDHGLLADLLSQDLDRIAGLSVVDVAGSMEEGTLHLILERERQVLALIGQGLSSTEIAARLSISLLTARTHRRNITAKLGFTGAELVLLASGRLPDQA